MYIIFSVLTLFYFFYSTKIKKEISLFSWYLMGQFLFLYLPYLIIKIMKWEFYLYQTNDIFRIGSIMIFLSNVVIIFFYLLFPKINFENLIPNPIVAIISKLIYLATLFSFLFAVFNIADIGLSNITANHVLRQRIEILGPFAIILMIPIGVSTFHTISYFENKKNQMNFYYALIFFFMAIIVAFFRGQRTDLILIFLLPMLYFFYKNKNVIMVLTFFLFSLAFSGIYAIFFKTNLQYLQLSFLDSIRTIITVDLDRNWTFWTSLSQSNMFSNNIMSNSYEGYLYTLTTFIPRTIFEMKGYSTETWFVSYMGDFYVNEWNVFFLDEIKWGITLSIISEGLINGGFLGLLISSFIIGVTIKIFDSFLYSYSFLYSCIPFIVVLLSGYTFFNILVIYMPILFTILILNHQKINLERGIING